MLAALLAASCGKENTDSEKDARNINVIYPDKDYTALTSIRYTLSANDTEGQVKELADLLADPAEAQDVRPAFNDKAVLLSAEIGEPEGLLIMDFAPSYKELTKTEEVLTRASIVETMTQLQDVSYVKFTVDGKALTDASGEEVGSMIQASFINDTGDEISTYAKRRIALYFTDREGEELIREDRTVVYAANTSPEKLIVQNLIEGPASGTGAYPTIPPDVNLLSVTVKDDVCYVNFDAALYEKPYDIDEEVVIYSIVDSLTELPNVERVQIAVEGVAGGVLFDHMELDKMYERRMEI